MFNTPCWATLKVPYTILYQQQSKVYHNVLDSKAGVSCILSSWGIPGRLRTWVSWHYTRCWFFCFFVFFVCLFLNRDFSKNNISSIPGNIFSELKELSSL